MVRRLLPTSLATCVAVLCYGMPVGVLLADSTQGLEFFEKKIRPVLVAHCYECHSSESSELQGGLRLDLRAGWQAGGASGQPAIVPGDPDRSPLIRAVRHDDGESAMPPEQSKLPPHVMADLTAWVRMGAPDPRDGDLVHRSSSSDWETQYQQRLQWWSLQPVHDAALPRVRWARWAQSSVDRFILAALEGNDLAPAPSASPRELARRLCLTLTGLPPDAEWVEQFVADTSDAAYERGVDQLLASPHFGEHWARHWMDVMHYSDTHGYEWDIPVKHAFHYRDYLIRAFNQDISYRQLVAEQIAGDLLEPRVDSVTGLQESLIGPMALRLGERRHGDNADVEGITQEAIANVIDTFGKGFLATTIACAQCHDHKLDAIEQSDYYALAGVFMSTRWTPRPVEAVDYNGPVIAQLRPIKDTIRKEMVKLWLQDRDGIVARIKAHPLPKQEPQNPQTPQDFPTSLGEFWQRVQTKPVTADEFQQERDRRISANQGLRVLADFTREDGAAGWQWDGDGMRHGRVQAGELVVALEGDAAVKHVLPAGRWSHVWSDRLAGSVQSPAFDPSQATTFSVEAAGGGHAAQAINVDRAFHSERMHFFTQAVPSWLTVTIGNFSSLEGTPDRSPRRVYVEWMTKSLNNNFPPRSGLGGVKDADLDRPHSWFGITRILAHDPSHPPQDELTRFVPLFEVEATALSTPPAEPDWATGLAHVIRGAVERWAAGVCDDEDVRIVNDALTLQWLANGRAASRELESLVDHYRRVELQLRADRTVGSASDWNEGRDERLAIRGTYTDLGAPIARGGIRALGGPATRVTEGSSGRRELAEQLSDPSNPLTARVYVNRVWHYLFGAGLVRTPDDFGHLGERPTHPELLDDLTARFIEDDWSTKRLIKRLVSSSVWRQSSQAEVNNVAHDPENRLWHHLPVRRLEAESIRDSMLVVAGRWNPVIYGPPIEPYRAAEDPQKRLYCGPIDGHGRRSLYLEMTLMEPPRFLALFNQPIPKITVGARDVTNVPDQALTMLNDPFVIAMARNWSQRIMWDSARTVEDRATRMFSQAFGRPPTPEETGRLVRLVEQSAKFHSPTVIAAGLRGTEGNRQVGDATGAAGAERTAVLDCQPAWQDLAHALFNLKEFVYVP